MPAPSSERRCCAGLACRLTPSTDRTSEEPDVGVCHVFADVPILESYRFQLETCSDWLEGEEREMYVCQKSRRMRDDNF